MGEAPKAMSGGLQPTAKYEHVTFEPCWPMKLELVGGALLLEPAVTVAALLEGVALRAD